MMNNDELSQKNSPSSYVRFLIKVKIDLHEFVSVQYNSNTFNIQNYFMYFLIQLCKLMSSTLSQSTVCI